MSHQNPITILTLYRPLFFYSKFFGCNAFQYPSLNQIPTKCRKISKCDFLIITMMIAIHTTGFILHFHYDLHSGRWKSLILNIGSRFAYLFGVLITVFSILWDVKNSNQIRSMIQALYDFDIDITSIGAKINYNTRKTTKIFFVSQIFHFSGTFYTIVVLPNPLPVKIVVLFYVTYILLFGAFTSSMSVHQFLIYNVCKRFQLINRYTW